MLSSVEKDAYYRKTNILTMTCTTNQRAHGTSSFQRAGKGRVVLVMDRVVMQMLHFISTRRAVAGVGSVNP
jgi:hypothetical protein